MLYEWNDNKNQAINSTELLNQGQ